MTSSPNSYNGICPCPADLISRERVKKGPENPISVTAGSRAAGTGPGARSHPVAAGAVKRGQDRPGGQEANQA